MLGLCLYYSGLVRQAHASSGDLERYAERIARALEKISERVDKCR